MFGAPDININLSDKYLNLKIKLAESHVLLFAKLFFFMAIIHTLSS